MEFRDENEKILYNYIMDEVKSIVGKDHKGIVIWMISFGNKSTMLEVHIKKKPRTWVNLFKWKDSKNNNKMDKDKINRVINEINETLIKDRDKNKWKSAVFCLYGDKGENIQYFPDGDNDDLNKLSDVFKERYLR